MPRLLPTVLCDVVQTVMEAKGTIATPWPPGAEAALKRALQRAAHRAVQTVLETNGLEEWPRDQLEAEVFEEVMQLLATSGYRSTLDGAFAARAVALSSWKEHLFSTGVVSTKPWMR